jgi:hypothetical protein
MSQMTRRMIFGVTIGLFMTSTGLAKDSYLPYRAVCEHPGCHWVGPSRAGLREAALDARDHWTRTRHCLRIEGPPLDGRSFLLISRSME